MFERFTREGRQVVMTAVEIGGRQGAGRIGAEHLLMALAADDASTAPVLHDAGVRRSALEAVLQGEAGDAALLAKLGIDLAEVKSRVERNFGEGAWARRSVRKGHIPFERDAKKALELSLRHALALKSKRIDARHILLGVLDSGPAVTEALSELGVEASQVKRRVLDVMRKAS